MTGSDPDDAPAEAPDETLMASVVARDQRAFRVLMGRHMGRAIRVAQRVVHNAAEADEIGQEAFLRVWNRASTFDPAVARFTTWLYRIVVNLALDRLRKPAFEPIEEAMELRSQEPEPVERLIEEEERRALACAMAELPERQRAAVALFHMEGLSGREAADVMRLSEKAFESLLSRARMALRRQIEKLQEDRRRCA